MDFWSDALVLERTLGLPPNCWSAIGCGDISPNRIYPRIQYRFNNWGVISSSILTPRHLTRNPLRHPIIWSGVGRLGGPPHTIPLFPVRSPSPEHHRPCGYTQIYHIGSPSASPQFVGGVGPLSWPSQFIFMLWTCAKHHSNRWSLKGTGQCW